MNVKQDKVTKKLDDKKNEKDFTSSPAKKKEQLDFIKKKSEINKTLATRDGVWKNRNKIKKTKSVDKSESSQILHLNLYLKTYLYLKQLLFLIWHTECLLNLLK